MDPLANIDIAATNVKTTNTVEERLKEIKKYLNGKISDDDLEKDAGKQLLHRRALFCTAIRDLWPDK